MIYRTVSATRLAAPPVCDAHLDRCQFRLETPLNVRRPTLWAGVRRIQAVTGQPTSALPSASIMKLQMKSLLFLVLAGALPFGLVAQSGQQQQLPEAPSASKYPPP